MRTKHLATTLSALAGFTAILAAATPAAAADLGGGLTINGGATIVSDYRYRGISQSDRRFAVQGTFSIGHESGFYATAWSSSIDDYVASGADQELDLVFGYRTTFGGTTVDAGVTYYYYPGAGTGNTDFYEPYVSVSHTFGPVTAKASAAYAPEQASLTVGDGDEDNLYLAGDFTVAVPSTPVSLTAHVGHSWGPSYITVGEEYTDWSLAASVTHNNLTASVAYVDTDARFITPSGRDAAGAGVVASVGVSF